MADDLYAVVQRHMRQRGMSLRARRDIGVYHARHAQALAECGEPEQAVAVARLAAPVAAQSGSARMRAELHALRQRMEPWRGGQPWRDLDDTLRALPRAGKAS
jgi:hypothetical protein